MRVAIRGFAYLLWVILWSPVVILGLIITPFIWIRVYKQAGLTVRECMAGWTQALINGIKSDLHCIRTGEW